VDSGPVTKLFRLARVPRLLKVIDIKRFQSVLKAAYKNSEITDKTIITQYYTLYSYHVFRLLLIALLITYFIGCIFLFVSENYNTDADVEIGKTFYQAFGLTEESGWTES